MNIAALQSNTFDSFDLFPRLKLQCGQHGKSSCQTTSNVWQDDLRLFGFAAWMFHDFVLLASSFGDSKVALLIMYYSQNPTIETSSVGDRVVLGDNVSRKAVVLNPTGAWLWGQLSTRSSADELVQKLQQRFSDVGATQLRTDVEKCLRDLTQQ